MVEPQNSTEAPSPTDSLEEPGLGSVLIRVSWLAILLGFVMEVLILLVAAGFEVVPGFGSVLEDLIGKVAWSTLVCAGLAIGTVVSSAARAPLMGLLGFISAPIAFHVSRALQQGVAKTIEEVSAGVSGWSQTLFVLALLKALEYGCLGIAIGWLGRRPWVGALAHAVTGLAVGIFFGGGIVLFTSWTAPEPLGTAGLFARALNEVLFPVGCSLVLYAATALGKRIGL